MNSENDNSHYDLMIEELKRLNILPFTDPRLATYLYYTYYLPDMSYYFESFYLDTDYLNMVDYKYEAKIKS